MSPDGSPATKNIRGGLEYIGTVVSGGRGTVDCDNEHSTGLSRGDHIVLIQDDRRAGADRDPCLLYTSDAADE